jgi:cephalosporin hydroxylase/2-polyprenyl-3-methyl-5-hydroxy-6-metoxy-1,4-benzoquinol methylase
MSKVEPWQYEPTGVSEFDDLQQPPVRQSAIDRFHYLYYHEAHQTWNNTYWMGVHLSKCPLDLWVYQEMLYELRPDVIIECGTFRGGSALYLGSLCDLLDHGRIYTVDIAGRPERPVHPRVEYVSGSSVDEEVVAYLRSRIGPDEKVLVILDSDHSQGHVRAELEVYATLVTPNSYIILEDTNVNGHPVLWSHGPGPMEALDDFLAEHDEFVIDTTREKFLLTFNPRGYLKLVGKRRDAVSTRGVPTSADGNASRPYPYRIDPGGERDTAHARAARLVGREKRVLDVGCGVGYLAKRLKAQDCDVVGIESDSSAALEASEHCRRVIAADITGIDWQIELGDEKFDYIVINDVLEHLADPAECLRSLRRFIAPNGSIIASIPNIAHGSVRLSLLTGSFQYRDIGLLDRTHIRFFTRTSVEQLFDEAGYAVRTIESIDLLPGTTEIPMPDQLPAALTEWMSTNEDAKAYQFIVVATPLRHGTETALRDRVRELIAQADELRQQIATLTFPVDDADDNDIEDAGIRRRMLQLRATVLDLRRQLAQRYALLERTQAELIARNADPLRDQLAEHRQEVATLRSAIRIQEEAAVKASAYVASLELSIRNLEQNGREKEAAIASLTSALTQKDQSIRELQNAVQRDNSGRDRIAQEVKSAVAERDVARAELAGIHRSRLWRIGGLYWRATKRLRGLKKD